jgi:hypothetical protein
METVLQANKECYVCGTTSNLESHHIFGGTANRKVSERYGLKVWLCHEHHTGNSGVHFNPDLAQELHETGQRFYETHYGTREDFRRDFGKSWL